MNKVIDLIKNESKDNVRLFKDKKSNAFFMVNEPSFVKEEANYNIINIYNEEAEKIGQVQYKPIYSPSKRIFLYNIFVSSKDDLGKGIGTYAIKFLEEVSNNKRFNSIEGKFFPKAPATGNQVRDFYERNGYSIDKDGYETIVYKYIMNEDIKTINTNTTMSEEGYKIYGELKGFNKEKELTA